MTRKRTAVLRLVDDLANPFSAHDFRVVAGDAFERKERAAVHDRRLLMRQQ